MSLTCRLPTHPIAPLVVLAAVVAAAAESPRDKNPAAVPGPVFVETDGLVIAEAESLHRPALWELRTDAAEPGGCERSRLDAQPTRFTGTGYLRWNGPVQSCAAQKRPEVKDGDEKHGDLTHACQGPSSDWLVMKVWTENPGTYQVDLRSYHVKEDGDNDVWIGHFGQEGTINRQTNCRTKAYSWGNYTRPVTLRRGLNAVYLAGRSHGYGVDRIAVFRPERDAAAHDPDTPESRRR